MKGRLHGFPPIHLKNEQECKGLDVNVTSAVRELESDSMLEANVQGDSDKDEIYATL